MSPPRTASGLRPIRAPRRLLLALLALLASARVVGAAAPVEYRFTFPEPQHHWMQVEAVFPDLPEAPLELRMSRSSPGRYSLHEFAKNVYDVHAYGRDGRELAAVRPDPSGWTVAGHGGRATVRYKVYGDVVDGTYLGIDRTHAHINMPAAVMWARGLEDRPATVTLTPPAGLRWRAATQLHPGAHALEFTAPNLSYLMDSPVEFGPIVVRDFSVGGARFRFAVHHLGSDADVDGLLRDVEKIVRQERAVFGEFPAFEPGAYTFLADYLPYAAADGMEHRNSTVMTEPGSIRANRGLLLATIAHELFHAWNVERIRPRSLEPFDLERANMSGELWLAEGFTEYYAALVLQRAGLSDLRSTLSVWTDFVEAAAVAPGRAFRSTEDMSRMAPFTDGGAPVDRTNWAITYTSYYPLGGAVALALDLALRDRSAGAVALDDFMRAMWRVHGRPGGAQEGTVDRPYTADDAEARLAEVSSDAAFARDFFRRYVHGREVPDFASLLARAGFTLRRRAPGRPWWGDLRLEARGGRVVIRSLAAPGSPAYAAGLDEDDELRTVGSTGVRSPDDVAAALGRFRPGDTVPVVYVDRAGAEHTATVVLAEDPHLEIEPVEAVGGRLSPAQRAFRDRWLSGVE